MVLPTEMCGKWPGGGTLAFGPGHTVYSIPPGQENYICAWTDQGERGDPDGMGMDFTDNSQPLAPSLVSPADGSDGQDTASVQLSWTCSDPDGHSLKYDVYICALASGAEAAFVPVASQITDNTYLLTHLEMGTEYLWSVVASDGQAYEVGPVWKFTTSCPSLTGPNPTTMVPPNGATGGLEVTFHWEKVDGASSYAMRIDTAFSGEQYQWRLDTLTDTTTTVTIPDTIPAEIYWQVKALSTSLCEDGSWTSPALYTDVDEDQHTLLPQVYDLRQNYPNPFNPSTVIQFDLPRKAPVSIAIFNLLGQRVIELANEEYPAGSHEVNWDGLSSSGQRVSTGIYFYRLVAGDYINTKKMLLLK